MDKHRARKAAAGAAKMAAAWLISIAIVCHLAGCAETGARPSSPSPAQSDLEQRLRELQQAEALYLSGRFKEAQSAFERLARTYPSNAEVWFRLGNTLMKEGLYDDAATALQTSLRLEPGNGRVALNLALTRLAQAQSAVDAARGRFEAGTAERQEVDVLDRRLRQILAEPTTTGR